MRYEPQNQNDLIAALESAVAGDTVILPKGEYTIPRIFNFTDVSIYSESENPFETILYPQGGGEMFKIEGSGDQAVLVGGFTTIRGGVSLNISGDGVTVRNFANYRGNRPLKISGDNHRVEGGLFYECEVVGIDVNGGFYDIFGRKDIRLKRELGLVDNLAPQYDDWTEEQLDVIRDLYYRRDMNLVVRNVVGVRCGFFGGNTYGAFVKIVPCGGGVTFQRNIDLGSLNGLWNDTPSSIPFLFEDNLFVDTVDDAVFVEIGTDDNSSCVIRNNTMIGVRTGIFVSGFAHAVSYGNNIMFRGMGKWVNGLSGNRVGNSLSCITPDGEVPDMLTAMDRVLYEAHEGAHVNAQYDFLRSEYYSALTEEPAGGYRSVLTENASKKPYGSTDRVQSFLVSGYQVAGLSDHPILKYAPALVEEIERAMDFEQGLPFVSASSGFPVDDTPGDTPTLPERVEVLEQKQTDLEKFLGELKSLL